MNNVREIILKSLDEIKLSQVGWEDNEDVMTFNGEPIGATVSHSLEIDRWWPDLKTHLATHLLKSLEARR